MVSLLILVGVTLRNFVLTVWWFTAVPHELQARMATVSIHLSKLQLFSSFISCPHSKFSHGLGVSEVELKLKFASCLFVFFPPLLLSHQPVSQHMGSVGKQQPSSSVLLLPELDSTQK